MENNTNVVIREPGVHRNSSYFHVNDGYHYCVNRSSETTIYFLCVHRRCPGRAVWTAGQNLSHTQPHTHHPDLNYALVRLHRRNVVERARAVQRYVSFRDIVEEERRRIPNNIASQFTYRRLRSAMQRSRAAVYPNIPQSLVELTTLLSNPAWHQLSATNDRQDNLFAGGETASDGSHVVMFVSERSLVRLRLAVVIFADGTFFITPSIDGCYQVFAIVTVHNHTVVPLVWFLMERKSEPAYIAALSLLRAKLQHWEARTVVCDYEDAMMNAFSIVLGVEVQGCLFHSAHAMAENARLLLGVIVLQNIPFMKMIVELCCALPLLPQHLLQRGFNVIVGLAAQVGHYIFYLLSTFLNYIQSSWLNHSNRSQTMSVSGSYFRTNNASESNNRRMKRKMGVHHPNVYQFIRYLADFEETSMADFSSLFAGYDPNRPRSVTAISNDIYIQQLTTILCGMAYVSDQELLNFLIAFSGSTRSLVNDTINPSRLQRRRII